jgi:hypothetical protein
MRPDVNPFTEAINILDKKGIMELLNRTLLFIYKESALIYYRFIDWKVGRLLTSPFTLSYTGKYRVSPIIDGASEFEFYYRFDSPHVRHRILGEYETEIGEKISEIHDENTDYWEVGVGWGYHSLSIADTVNQVIGFDPDTRRTDLFRKSCNKNNFENISLVTDEVDSLDSYLDEFGYPDVVLIDIDGWEYDVIPNSPKLLDHGCKWIVEIHHDVDVPPAEEGSPGDIEERFEEYGYNVETIREHHQQGSWRGDSKDVLNTHHIFAQSE